MKYTEGSKKVFMNTGTRFQRQIIWAVALIKKAAAHNNVGLGLLGDKVGRAIADAAEEVVQGRHDASIEVDIFQTGSGTGINMNVNEVIAERASEILGSVVHPNDHVNMGQSSNDVAPTAIRVAAVSQIREKLAPGLKLFSQSLSKLAANTSGVYKAGRTHLRDALPVTMGQEFEAFADAFRNDLRLSLNVLPYLRQLPIGGTAVGTGMNSHPRFGALVVKELNQMTGLNFLVATSRFRATRLLSDMVAFSATMRVIALDLYRLCQDIRLMFSGPLTGLGEIDLPTQEEVAGSSIMPGKTNPVTVEAALLVSSQVIGLDQANHMAGMLGEFELSMGVPLIGYNVVMQVDLLSEAFRKMSGLVIENVVAQKERTRKYAESTPALITVISPKIGYDMASTIGKRLGQGTSIREALKELGYSSREVDRILDMKRLVRPGVLTKRK